MKRWWLAIFLFRCGYDSLEEHPCPTTGTKLTYDNFGKDFLSEYCQRCHGQIGPGRKGAPSGYDFGRVEDVRAWRPRIFARAALGNTTMPPGPDDPPETARGQLGEWLSCEAP